MEDLIETQLRTRARALLTEGRIDLFLGYRQGSNPLRVAPFAARTPLEVERLVWNAVAVPNLAAALTKYASQRVGVALKACDARSVAELLKLNQLERSRLHIIGVACWGMADPEQIAAVAPGPVSALVEEGAELLISTGSATLRRARAELLLARCATCPSPTPELFDEQVGDPAPAPVGAPNERFVAMQTLASMDAPARLAFWSEQLSKCTLCYACRTVCPLCYCTHCALTLERDDPRRQTREPASVFSYHMLRAYHLSERCTGCDECERVCPEEIPLSLVCRKLEHDRGQP